MKRLPARGSDGELTCDKCQATFQFDPAEPTPVMRWSCPEMVRGCRTSSLLPPVAAARALRPSEGQDAPSRPHDDSARAAARG